MSEERKEREDRVLRKLPEKKQDEIIEYLETVSVRSRVKPRRKKGEITPLVYYRRPRLWEAVEWLKKDGIESSAPALSQFRQWYKLNRTLRAIEEDYKAQMFAHLTGRPRTAAEDREMAQQFFNRMAMAHNDLKSWSMAQRLEIARAHLQLQRERFIFDATQATIQHFATVRNIVDDPTLDHKARIDAVRLELFGPPLENETQKQ